MWKQLISLSLDLFIQICLKVNIFLILYSNIHLGNASLWLSTNELINNDGN